MNWYLKCANPFPSTISLTPHVCYFEHSPVDVGLDIYSDIYHISGLFPGSDDVLFSWEVERPANCVYFV